MHKHTVRKSRVCDEAKRRWGRSIRQYLRLSVRRIGRENMVLYELYLQQPIWFGAFRERLTYFAAPLADTA